MIKKASWKGMSSDQKLGWLGLYGIILPIHIRYIGIMIRQYQDPYQPTSISYFMSLVITAMFDPSLVFSSKTRSVS